MSTFEPVLLPDEVKQEMCEALLVEFGATSINTRSNGEMIVRCVLPWHPERRPSASLNYQKMTYKCLGCGSGGGLLWLIATCRGVSGPEARGWLESTGAVGGSTTFDLTALLAYLDALERARDQRREPVPMPVFSERVLEPWDRICPLLTTGVPDLGLPGRGIPEDNLRTARVGWNTDAMRVVIPHWWKGDLVGWQSRRLTDDGSPKYESTVDFPRDRTIYRLPERSDTLVVVESPMSVLRHLHHLDIAATFGAAITEQQILLMRWYPRVVFWLDNDPAGWEALEGKPDPATRSWRPGALERVSAYTQVAVVDSDWHADPADLDDDEADRLVQEAVPHTLWHRPTGALRCLRCRQPHGGYCADQTTGELVRG